MKSLRKHLLPAALGVALAGTAGAAPWPPATGDLVLGVQASANPGKDTNVLFNLGPAFQIRDNAEQGAVVNIAADLAAAFGANWFSRTDLWFGVIANSGNTAVNGDNATTIYASRATSTPGGSTNWSQQAFSLPTAGTGAAGIYANGSKVTKRGNGVVTITKAANSDGLWQNAWTSRNPFAQGNTPGASFGIFAGELQNNFGKASNASSLVDVQRLTSATGTGAATVTKEATVGITRRGDVVLSANSSVFNAAKAIADLQATQYYIGDSVNVNVGAGLAIAGGLPTGVSYDATSGVISGTITAAPTTQGVVTVRDGTTVIATLENFSVNVAQYPFLGSYDVLIQDGDSTPVGLPEGRIRLTITKPGTFTASAVKKGSTTALALTGTFTPTATSTTVQLTLTFSNAMTAIVNLSSTSNLVTGSLTETGQSVAGNDTLTGFRAASGPAVARALTASLATTGGNRTSVPAGFGFATGSLAATGSATFAGTLGDGQKFTTSFNASLTDQAVVYVQPYSTDLTSSFIGGIINLPNLGQRNSAGAASFGLGQTNRPAAGLKWRKTAIAGASYDAGFGPLDVTGAVSSFTPVPAGIKAPGDRLAAQLGARSNTFVAAYANATTTPADSSAANPDALLDNETEALPKSYLMGASPVTFNDPSITGRFFNEVQVITLSTAPAAGLSATVKVGTGTASAAFALTNPSTAAATLQTQLEGLAEVGLGNVVVSAESSTVYRATFTGTKGYQDIAAITVAKSGTTGPMVTFTVSELVKGTGNALTTILVDEVQRIAIPATGVDSFTLGFKGATTSAINYNATQATTATNIQTALRALSNIGVTTNVTVAAVGTDADQAFTVTFSGALGKSDQAALMATVVTPTTNKGTITVTEVGKGGAIATRVSGTAMGTTGTFSASVLLNNAGLKGTVEGVFLQDDSFGTVNGRGQVRIPVAAGASADFETIPVTLSTN